MRYRDSRMGHFTRHARTAAEPNVQYRGVRPLRNVLRDYQQVRIVEMPGWSLCVVRMNRWGTELVRTAHVLRHSMAGRFSLHKPKHQVRLIPLYSKTPPPKQGSIVLCCFRLPTNAPSIPLVLSLQHSFRFYRDHR